ncbi:hypothetical protein B4U79_03702 [Dinothrombium tinctorium]|uniref:Chitin-binding type-2 domain-containing protein n=1 Tax=Dinothrombium tinctorium TaxID=1965070 RepID=A0A443RA69_9ACAR|nr:hypothetical protein B4U79_03702 [Dinothrombium tinctorium]
MRVSRWIRVKLKLDREQRSKSLLYCERKTETTSSTQLVRGERYTAFQLLPSAANRSIFVCPEKFGYFPDKRDCTRYFVCVFGEPLHESCTGGLYFSAELQTCDWPRNVLCSNDDQDRSEEKSFYNVADRGEEDDTDYDYNTSDEKKQLHAVNVTRKLNDVYNGIPSKNFTSLDAGYRNNVDNTWEERSSDKNFNRSLNALRSFQSQTPNKRAQQTKPHSNYDNFRKENEQESSSPSPISTTLETPKIDIPHNNKINSDVEPQPPKYEEAIPALVDSKGGIHFSDGPGGTYALSEQLPGVLNSGTADADISVFIKPLYTSHENGDKDFIAFEKNAKQVIDDRRLGNNPKAYNQYIPVITPEKLLFKTTRNPFELEEREPKISYRSHSASRPRGSLPLLSENNRYNVDKSEELDDRKEEAVLRSEEGVDYQREPRLYQPSVFKSHIDNFNKSNLPLIESDLFSSRNAYNVPNADVVVIPVVVKNVNRNRAQRGRVRVVPRKKIKTSTPQSLFENDDFGVYFDDERSFVANSGQRSSLPANGPSSNQHQYHQPQPQQEHATPGPQSFEKSKASTSFPHISYTQAFTTLPQPPQSTLRFEPPLNHENIDLSLTTPRTNINNEPYLSTPTQKQSQKKQQEPKIENHPTFAEIVRLDGTQKAVNRDKISKQTRKVIDNKSENSGNREVETFRKLEKQDETFWSPLDDVNKFEGTPLGIDYSLEYDYDEENKSRKKQSAESGDNVSRKSNKKFKSPKTPKAITITTTTTSTTTTTTTSTTTPSPLPIHNQVNTRKARPTNKRLIIKHKPRPKGKSASRPANVYETPVPLTTAKKCDSNVCLLPDCKCGSSAVPGNLSPNEIPQIVVLTFDDAINDLNWEIYEEIFAADRKNPNGCPILGTFYVSHEWTDYGQVQTLYSRGHEMASHGITHSFGEKFSKNQWLKEINGQREILNLYGGVALEDVRGMRAPFLQIGGNKMFEMLFEANFTYDSSMPVFDNKPPFWPYTLDYSINHECMISPCPTKSFPGVWEVAMIMWEDLRGGRCSMGDACSNPSDEKGVYEMLMKNFNRHYKSNRAPFGLFYHSAWFTTPHHKRGFTRFIDEILGLGDVYFTTNWQMLQWMRNPTQLSDIESFEPWRCNRKDSTRPTPCHHPNVCNVRYQSGSRFMKTCQACPNTYPWVGNTGFGKSKD